MSNSLVSTEHSQQVLQALLLAVAISAESTTTVIKPRALEPPFPGATVTDVSWEIPTDPNNPNITTTFNGTVQQAVRFADSIHPDIAKRWLLVDEATVAARRAKRSLELESRGEYELDWWECMDANGPAAGRRAIESGIYYLDRVSGKPRNGKGPHACGRVSCEHESAIWWCNDHKTNEMELNSFSDIGTGAWVVLNSCRFGPVGTQWERSAGYAHYKGKWNVVVKRDQVDC